jgi:hypothetical protein
MSADRNLEYAICLLALITKRLPGPEQAAERTETIANDENSLYDYADDESDDLNDATALDINDDPEQYRIELKNQFLDRLAEILARFKATSRRNPGRDAKHVSAAMMVRYETGDHVKIFCAKNEGLDQEDILFLEEWKSLMEGVARKGSFHLPSSIL